MTRRVAVLTGGPGAGKTTLLEALAARGHAVVPEAAMQVIEALIAETGSVEGCREWRAANLGEFQLRIARAQAALEAEVLASGAPLVFCDHGLIDGLAYLERRDQPAPAELQRLIEASQYDVVFLLATLTDFDSRPETGRISTRSDSLALAQALREAYESRGLPVIDVPEATVADRAEQVLAAL